jgi:hypothetical protein
MPDAFVDAKRTLPRKNRHKKDTHQINYFRESSTDKRSETMKLSSGILSNDSSKLCFGVNSFPCPSRALQGIREGAG